MKAPFGPRASLARRFVDWYVAKTARASRPIAHVKLLFALVTASLLAHFLVVYGEYVFGAPMNRELDSPTRASTFKVSRSDKHDDRKKLADIAKVLEQIAELEAKTTGVARKVLDLTEEDRRNARKDAKMVGGHNDNDQGSKKRPPDETKAVVSLLESPDKVAAKPEKVCTAEPTAPTARAPMAAPDVKTVEPGKPVDPDVDLGPTKKLHPGTSKEDREGAPKPVGAPAPPRAPTIGVGAGLRSRAEQLIAQNTDDKKRAEIVDTNLRQMDDWTRYKLEGGPSPRDGVPGIFISNSSAADWKEIVSHFDLCPIAYPDARNYFVRLDVVSMSLTKAEGEGAMNDLKARYASSGIAFSKRKLWSTAVFSAAAERACERYGIPKSEINFMILAPKQVMSYMAWKARSTVKDEGLEPAKVRACHARFRRTSDGWILEVTDVVLEDGSVRRVKT